MAVGVQEAICCGSVMVEPGDAVVADGDGVAMTPHRLADEVAKRGAEQEKVEVWIKAQIERGAKLSGLYPPTDDEMARWKLQRG